VANDYTGLVRVLCVPYANRDQLWHESGRFVTFTRCPAVGELIDGPGGDDTLKTAVKVISVFHRSADTDVVFWVSL